MKKFLSSEENSVPDKSDNLTTVVNKGLWTKVTERKSLTSSRNMQNQGQ